jgi:glycine oxidase
VIGGGAFGLATALALARRGAEVSVHVADPWDASASAVAAGMLSPVYETLETGDLGQFDVLRAALEAWDRFGLAPVDRSGGLYVDAPETPGALGRFLTELGVVHDQVEGEALRALQPALSPDTTTAWRTPLEARVDPLQRLPELRRELQARGGRIVAEAAPSGPEFTVWRAGFDAVVIAAGHASRAWAAHAPALANLAPIKGHILHFQGGPTSGPAVRRREDYVAPQPSGAVFGATMQAGQADAGIEPEVVDALHARASDLTPALAATPFTPRTGVRAATPDGLPMAGALGAGLFAATGARRNGWLLAPLVAETVADVMAGEPSAFAAAFDPLRFG